MINRLRNRQKGFTLIELLIVVAIIGIIAVLLIPNFLDSLQKAKQKRTEADVKNVGTAFFSWLTDELSAAAAGAGTTLTVADYTGTTDFDTIQSEVSPRHIQGLPVRDGWKTPYYYNLNINNPTNEQVMLIASGGRDGGGAQANSFTPQATYTFGSFDPTDYDQDIIWADGIFVRWAQKIT